MRRNASSRVLYETAANLGSFYIHAGQRDKGLSLIDKALQINPDAHFGREKYQRLFVEYVMTRGRNGVTPLPLGDAIDKPFVREGRGSFLQFVVQKQGTRNLDEPQRQAAVKGILGMMKFSNHEAPMLLEALGELLSSIDDPKEDAKQLAAGLT